MKENKQREAARLFAQEWACEGYEKGQAQKYWLELFVQVLKQNYRN